MRLQMNLILINSDEMLIIQSFLILLIANARTHKIGLPENFLKQPEISLIV